MKWIAYLAVLAPLALPVDAQVRLASSKRAAQDKPAAPAYEDRVIEGLEPYVDEPAKAYDTRGWPRFLRLETRLATRPAGFDDGQKGEVGVVVSGSIETPNHGVLSLDATSAPSDGGALVTLRQRGLPLDGGWFINNELGVVTPVPPAVMRLPSRVFVPSFVTLGATTEWLHPGERVQLQASTGRLGRLQGYPVPGFEELAGNVTTLAAQAAHGPFTVAARHAIADGVSYFDTPAARANPVTERSTQVAVRHETGPYAFSANLVGSRARGEGGTRYGVWMEGEHKTPTSTRAFGIYRLDTELSWAGQPMASDVEGAYARGSFHARQWNVQGSLDVLRPVSGHAETGVLVTASGQYRYSRRLSFGAGGAARRYAGEAANVYGDVRWQHDWGTTGVRAEASRYDEERVLRIGVDHDWPLPLGWTLATSVSGGRESGTERAGSLWGAALSVAAPLSARATLLGNASFDRRGNGESTASANVSLVWQLARDWALEGNFVYSRGTQQLFVPVDPLAPLPERFTLATDTHALYLVLRYETRAGSRTQPLGGPVQGGGGSVSGVVFLDANRNGLQEAGERGAAGVTVYLDGRYATRTDAQGRFEFPFVAPGARVVTILNETLPLPWEAGPNARRRVEVRVRETARVPIAVERRTD